MSIKNLRIRMKLSEVSYFLAVGAMFLFFVSREFYDEQEQIASDSSDYLADTVDEEGNLCHAFLPGEHRIKRTRIDSFGYETEPIDGYMIESVVFKPFGSNKNIVTYVNTLPVIVQGEEREDGTVTFDQFGEVITKDSVKTIGSIKN